MINRTISLAVLSLCLTGLSGCKRHTNPVTDNVRVLVAGQTKVIVDYAINQTVLTPNYDASYKPIKYPGGDVPIDRGACIDVVIRSFRKAGVDLQKDIHEDMQNNFAVYPNRWGLNGPDTNIDHRRVPNLMKYFQRKGKEKEITNSPRDYQPGDIVAWETGGVTHIGIVSNIQSDRSANLMMIHNIGNGAKAEDVLFNWHIIGHYRYF